ncbi:dhhc-9 [Pristionchus pacificus]|uniref:Palmitoyltransferase n=1 Tax=Pristionchus pacificus TaxID=54126 RepID=A0A454XL51_PRIPA|nr:dhhc-9 [Pristionchus pacificus]|eukprot:PDM84096.1 dhhc-9 [Pristionchus pacificus]
MTSTCDKIENFLDGPFISQYVNVINKYIRGLGNILIVVVYCITLLLVITSFGIILPYEQWYQPPLLLLLYSIIGFFLFVNIMYHYYKARTIAPIHVPGKDHERWCFKCEHRKTIRTHHCGICQRCVLGMDHHCIWINQCVGSHNHRHFFLFIANLTVATFIIVIAGYHTAYDHFFEYSNGKSFCSAFLDYAPLQAWICSIDGFSRNAVIFSYLLAALLMCLVGFLTGWNMFLISKGFTYIDYLQHSDHVALNATYRNPLDQGFRRNWKNFLGLRRNRSFFKHVILPSSHPAFLLEEEEATTLMMDDIV